MLGDGVLGGAGVTVGVAGGGGGGEFGGGDGDGGGGRVWFRAKVVALRSRYPPLHVKYTATLEGTTHRLALPEPVTAYVNADGVRRIAS